MKKKIINKILMLLAVGLFFAGPALAQNIMSGQINGSGTYFEIKDSDYLNITLESTEEIKVILESIPRMISMDISSSTDDFSTVLTIKGLEPNKTYYKYQNSYKNEAVFISDENGIYTWTQDLTQPHHVWIQEIEGTTFISENTVLDHDITGSVEIVANNITLDCNGHSITGTGTGYGIYLNNKSSVNIKNCTVRFFYDGMYLRYSSANTFINNTSLYNYSGVYLYRSDNNTIIENTANSNRYDGITVSHSSENTITKNKISKNIKGIDLFYSTNTTIIENIFENDGIFIFGSGIHHFNTHVIENNTINRKPIYYYKNVSNIKVPEDAGQVILANCTNMIIENINAPSNSVAIEIAYTSMSSILNNIINLNYIASILLIHSNNNEIIGNYSNSNLFRGIALNNSDTNTVTNNILSNHETGIYLDYSNNNKIYHNNFIDNYYQAYIYGGEGNLFDNGYPLGGNYWSDYTGADEKSGENQNQPGADGIGDTPYTFTGGEDRYPFMIESGWEAPPIPIFEPDEDGFGFQNFCPVYFDEQLEKEVARTWDMFTQFFGQETTMLGGDRRFTAERYFEEKYAVYNPESCGSCDGFSGTSLINFENLEQPNSGIFNMPYYDGLYLQSINNDIKEAIAFQQGFQFGHEAIAYFSNLEQQSLRSPKFFYKKIKQAIDNKKSIVVWIFEKPKKWEILKKEGGHSVVPYKYKEDNSEEMGYVYVYDSNYPGDNNRMIEFDLEKDEWTYKFEKGFWILGETWNGDVYDSYLTIAVMPLDMRLNKGIPPWAQEVSPYYYIASVDETTIPLFINEGGERIGIFGGEFINEMLDATYFIPLTQDQDTFSGLYYLPQEDNYNLTLYNEQGGGTDFIVFGNQSSIKFTSDTDISGIDNIKLGRSSLTYTTDSDYKEYSISFTKESNDLSRLIEIDTNILKKDTNVIELIEDGFKYVNNGDAKTYDLTLKQRGLIDGEVYFPEVEIGRNETQFIYILNQNDINNSEIIIEIDENSDGIIDKEKSLQLVFEDPKRGTKLIINTTNSTFQFIAPDKEFPIKKADWMKIIELPQQPSVLKYNFQQLNIDPLINSKLKNLQFKEKPGEIIQLKYYDKEIMFSAVALRGRIDFCSAHLIDFKTRKHYLLIDKKGK